jgi:nicotinate-nucleotide adenylyltransferase
MNLVFGGSFNPPHSGHVEAVKGLLDRQALQGVSQVMILPSFGTPLKEVSVSFEQRFEMTRLAFEELKASDRIHVSDFEAKEKTQFTWQVLEGLRGQLKDAAFVIGTDQFEKLDQWARYPDLMGLCDWVVLLRKPRKLPELEQTIRKFTSQGWLQTTSNDSEYKIKVGTNMRKLVFIPTDAKESSSTNVRELIALGKKEELKTLIPERVYEYIERNQLYGI